MSRRGNPQRGCINDGEGRSGSQSTLSGTFLKSGAHRSSAVEIIDDDGDEVREVDPYEFSPSTNEDDEHLIVRRPRTRRKRREVQSNWNSDEEKGEDEDWQFREALRQSCLDAERDEERRAMCGDASALVNPEHKHKSSTNEQEATKEDNVDERIHSKPSTSQETLARQSFTLDGDNSDHALSLLLFQETEEDQPQDEPEPIETDDDLTNSPPIPVTSTSPAQPAREINAETAKAKKDDDIELSPVNPSSARSVTTGGRSKLNLNRSKFGNADSSTKSPGKSESPGVNRKRKWQQEDSSGATPVQESENTLGRKIQLKVLNFTGSVRKLFSTASAVKDTATKNEERIVLDEEDEEEKQKVTETRSEDQIKPPPSRKIKLARCYRKSKLTNRSPITLADAMKAQLYFAPPGVDVNQYMGMILKLFERSNKRLRSAQSRLLDKMEWGGPVMPGPRRGKSLDAAKAEDISDEKPRAVSTYGGSIGVKKHTATATSERSRSHRSTRGSLKFAPTPASTSKRTSPTLNSKSVVEDDSDDDDFDMMSKPMWETPAPTWKECVAKAASEGMGLSVEEEVFIPPSTKTLQPSKRNNCSTGGIEKDPTPEKNRNGHAAQGKGETSDDALPPKRSKVEETLTVEREPSAEKIPSEDCDLPMASSGSDTGTPELGTKRRRKVSSDSDETDDERDEILSAKSPSMEGRIESPSKAGAAETKGEPQEMEEKPSDLPKRRPVSPVQAKPATNSPQSQEYGPNVSQENEQSRSTSLSKPRIIDSRSTQSPVKVNDRRERSEAAHQAAAAAEKRLLRGFPVPSTSETSTPDPKMQCPMCFDYFSQKEIQAHASDCNGVHSTQPSSAEVTTSQEQRQEKSGDGHKRARGPGAGSALDFLPLNLHEPSASSASDRNGDRTDSGPKIEKASETGSDTDDSDKQELLVLYGSKVQTKSRKSWDEGDEENERALLQLAGLGGKTRRGGNDESDSDYGNENFEMCFFCKNLIPKEEYLEHVNREMAKKKQHCDAKDMRRKVPLKIVNPQPKSLHSGEKIVRSSKRSLGKDENESALARLDEKSAKRPRLEKKASRTSSSFAGMIREEASTSADTTLDEQHEEQDVLMTEISDSPIKTFKLIDEHSSLDYKNQFEHLKSGKSGRGKGRGRGRGRDSRREPSGKRFKKWKRWKR